MKLFVSIFFKKEEETIADCEEEIPGINPEIIETRKLGIVTHINSLFNLVLFVMFCFGIELFSFKLINNVEIPKRPESKGNKGFDNVGRLRTSNPKDADIVVTSNAFSFEPGSFIIKKKTEKTSIRGIYDFKES